MAELAVTLSKQSIEELADAVAKRIQPERSGASECFHCGERSVVWQSDFSFEDYDLEGEGIVQVCRCGNCGAEIMYMIREDEDGEL